MNGTHLAIALVATAMVVPVVGASVDTTGCTVFTQKATRVGDFYAWGAYEIWQESNGIPGLQRGTSSCDGRPSLGADTCFTHSADRQLVRCVQSAPASTLP